MPRTRSNGSLSKNKESKPGTADNLALAAGVEAAREDVQQKNIPREEARSDGPEPDWKEVPRPSRMWNALEFRCLVLLQDLQARGHSTRPCFASDAALHLYWENSVGFTFEDLNRIEKSFIDTVGELPVDEKLLPTRAVCEEAGQDKSLDWWAAWEKVSALYFRGLPAREQERLREVFKTQAKRRDWVKLFDTPRTTPPPKSKTTERAATVENEAVPVEKRGLAVSPEPEAKLDPVVRASMDLAARAALVLQTDSWLSRLAEHSPDMRTKILAALSDELLRTGSVNSDYCAKLYNDLRPRALSAFPPRQF